VHGQPSLKTTYAYRSLEDTRHITYLEVHLIVSMMMMQLGFKAQLAVRDDKQSRAGAEFQVLETNTQIVFKDLS